MVMKIEIVIIISLENRILATVQNAQTEKAHPERIKYV